MIIIPENLHDKLSNTVKSMLTHLNSNDRQEAILMLIFIGIKHYKLLYSHNDRIDLSYLRALCDKYYQEITANETTAHVKKNKIIATYATESQAAILNNTRVYRPDAMSHFPFADNISHVEDVLTMPSTEMPKLLDMGAPARRRLVVKVFHELCFEKRGIRMSDIPEALQRLGLTVSSTLRQILQRTHGEEKSAYYQETCISLMQWESIIKRLIYMIRRGKQPQDIVHLFIADRDRIRRTTGTSSEGDGSDYHLGGQYDDSDYEYNSDDDHNYLSAAIAASRANGEAERKNGDADYVDASHNNDFDYNLFDNGNFPEKKPPVKKTKRSPEKMVKNLAAVEGRYRRHLQQVPSRIASAVQNDRTKYNEARGRRDIAVKKTLAQRRVDTLTSTAVPLGFRDRNWFSEPRLFHSVPRPATVSTARGYDSRHSKFSDTVRNKRYETRQYNDLDSGLATMEIADAFLEGSVGKELLSSSEPDYRTGIDPETMSPEQAQRTATALLGLESREEKQYRRDVYASGLSSRPPTSHSPQRERSFGGGSGPSAASEYVKYGHRSSGSKRLERTLDDEAKRRYEAPGWRNTRGGWVADFGPSHTHTLYTGAESPYKLTVDDKPWLRSSGELSQRHEHQRRSLSPSRKHSNSSSFHKTVSRQNVSDVVNRVAAEEASGGGGRGRDVGVSDEMLLNINADIDNSRPVSAYGSSTRGDTRAPSSIATSGMDSTSIDTAVAGAGEGYDSATAKVDTMASTIRTRRNESATNRILFGDETVYTSNRSKITTTNNNSNLSELRRSRLMEEDAFKDAQDDEFLSTLQDSVSLNAAVKH